MTWFWLGVVGLTAALFATACASPDPGSPTTAQQVLLEPLVVETAAPLATSTPMPARGPLDGQRICIDPGHDAFWAVGAAGRLRNGALAVHPVDDVRFNEHELTLTVAERLIVLLEAEGAAVCLTRHTLAEGGGVLRQPYDFNGDGVVRPNGRAIEDTPEIIQPRIDIANEFGAAMLLSIHFNGSSDASVRGSEAYFSDIGPNAVDNRRLAAAVLANLLAEMRDAGHVTTDLGIKDDLYQRYSEPDFRRLLAANAAVIRANGQDPARCPDCYRQMTLGNNPMSRHRANYAGVLVEVEFLSNPAVVEDFLMRPDALDVVAQGLMRGLVTYFDAD